MIRYQTYPFILESHQAREITEELGLKSEADAAAEWFANVAIEDTFEAVELLPQYHRYLRKVPCVAADLYYDYGADYYFLVREVEVGI